MRVVLVTGGAGFVGSHLVDALLAHGDTVRVLDNFSTGTLGNLALATDRIEIIVGDLGNLDLVRRATEGTEIVFHQAMPIERSALLGSESIAPSLDIGTLHVLIAAHQAGVRRVIHASSFLVYDTPSCLPVDENAPLAASREYTLAKLAGEEACLNYSREFGLETTRLRYWNVYGPRAPAVTPYSVVIARTLRALQSGEALKFEDDGRMPQDFIFVGDVVHANLLVADASRVSGKVYNIAGHRSVTPRVIVATLEAITSIQLRPEYGPPRPRGELDTLANPFRAEAELGFCASYDLVRGLHQCVDFSASRSSR